MRRKNLFGEKECLDEIGFSILGLFLFDFYKFLFGMYTLDAELEHVTRHTLACHFDMVVANVGTPSWPFMGILGSIYLKPLECIYEAIFFPTSQFNERVKP